MKKETNPIFKFFDRISTPVLDNHSKFVALQTMEKIDLWEKRLRDRECYLPKESIPEYFNYLSEIRCFNLNGEPSIIKMSEDGNRVTTVITPTKGSNEYRVSVKGINSGLLTLIISHQESENSIPIYDSNLLPESISKEFGLLRLNEEKERLNEINKRQT